MGYFLEKYKSPKLTQEDENKPPIHIIEIENVVKEYPQQRMRPRNFSSFLPNLTSAE